jgi:hypothetical protein
MAGSFLMSVLSPNILQGACQFIQFQPLMLQIRFISPLLKQGALQRILVNDKMAGFQPSGNTICSKRNFLTGLMILVIILMVESVTNNLC